MRPSSRWAFKYCQQTHILLWTCVVLVIKRSLSCSSHFLNEWTLSSLGPVPYFPPAEEEVSDLIWLAAPATLLSPGIFFDSPSVLISIGCWIVLCQWRRLKTSSQQQCENADQSISLHLTHSDTNAHLLVFELLFVYYTSWRWKLNRFSLILNQGLPWRTKWNHDSSHNTI